MHEPVHPVAVFPAHRYGLVQPRGDVTADSVVRSGLALLALPAWEPGFDEVWDFRSAGAVSIGPSGAAQFRALERDTREALVGSRTLIVTGGRLGLAFGARFYDRLVRPLGRTVLVCRTADEALAHLTTDAIPELPAG